MKKKILFAFLTCATITATAQNVNIPDVNFKNALLADPLINDDLNGEISVMEAASHNGYITVSGLGITDLTGIEAFTGTIYLDCSNNALTTLDLSANTGLANILKVEYNQLTSITFPTTSNVTSLRIEYNPIVNLDVSALSNMTNLYAMNCGNLTSLEVGNNTNLTVINISQTGLTSVDFSGAINLESLVAIASSITGVLDVSDFSSLAYLSCQQSNYLTQINFQNGNNMSVPPGGFTATDCPLLTCVQVDNVTFANAVWSSAVDGGVTFSLDCNSSTPMATSIDIQGFGGATTITTAGGTLQMTATILPINASQSVNWGIISGSSFATIDASGLLTATANGTVTVGGMTTDGTNLFDTQDIVITGQTSGINDNETNLLSVFPNPANNQIEIIGSTPIESISIYNTNGQLILTTNENGIDVSDFPSGLYYVVVNSQNGIAQTRFVKQ